MKRIRNIFLICLLSVSANHLLAISVSDDLGNQVTLERPAGRIISLAPHTTELLFAAGAGNKVVGAVQYSDYPDAAKEITRIGNTNNLDIEKIVSLNPDLIIAWHSNAVADTEILRKLGIPVYVSEPPSIDAIAKSILDLGIVAGTENIARQTGSSFLSRLNKLKKNNSGKSIVSTFYQIWNAPIYTVNGDHIISHVIQLCGGKNIFDNLKTLSTQLNIEAVIEANPEVIIASGTDDSRPVWLDDWKTWQNLTAVKQDNLYFIPPDLIQRHTPRILDGAEMMCKFLDKARNK